MKTKELAKFQKTYNNFVSRNKDVIETEVKSSEEAQKIIDEGYANIEKVQLIDIGKRNLMSFIMNLNVTFIAFYKALKANGYPIRTSVRLLYKLSDRMFERIPKFIRKIIGFTTTTKFWINKLKKFGDETQKREYKDNYVWTCRDTCPQKGYVLDINECAVRKFQAVNDIPELIPYCSFFDYIQAAATGLGIKHTHNGNMPMLQCVMEVTAEGKQEFTSELKSMVEDIEIKSAL